MSFCLTYMGIKAENEEGYKTVQDWSKNFEKEENISENFRQSNAASQTISYIELNVNETKAEEIFKGFARYCVSKNVSGKIEMSFDITFGNSGEEYQLLYELKDGVATERIAQWDDSEDLYELLGELLPDYGFDEEADELDEMFSDYLSGDVSEDDYNEKVRNYAELIKGKLDDYDRERLDNASLTEEEQESRLIMWRENPDYGALHKVDF